MVKIILGKILKYEDDAAFVLCCSNLNNKEQRYKVTKINLLKYSDTVFECSRCKRLTGNKKGCHESVTR